MTKYIDKYYLNGTEYKIKFGGGGGGWQPGANTIAYYPLTSNADDDTGTYNGTATDVTYTTISSGLGVAQFNGSTSKIDISNSLVNGSSTFTINTWICSSDNSVFGDIINNQTNDNNGVFIDNLYGDIRCGVGGGNASSSSISTGIWYNIVITYNSGVMTAYTNGTQVFTDTHSYATGTNMQIGTWASKLRYFKGYISNVIFEDKVWTEQEISDYFNQTKSLYGIS